MIIRATNAEDDVFVPKASGDDGSLSLKIAFT
ncbi:MAG: hypothetical protein K0S84_1102 [Nitrososphaera sp.]|nr:hypothetical protein [Nitrososphaera sp.]